MLSWRSFTQTGEKISGKVYRIYTNLENISMKSLKDKSPELSVENILQILFLKGFSLSSGHFVSCE